MKILRESTSQKPSEEMADLRGLIAAERSRRRSLRILQRPQYVQQQTDVLRMEIQALESKISQIEARAAGAADEMLESMRLEGLHVQRLAVLRNRQKVEKMVALVKEIHKLEQGAG